MQWFAAQSWNYALQLSSKKDSNFSVIASLFAATAAFHGKLDPIQHSSTQQVIFILGTDFLMEGWLP